jgi:hypothetical protein
VQDESGIVEMCKMKVAGGNVQDESDSVEMCKMKVAGGKCAR